MKLIQRLLALFADQRGAIALEYGLISALVVLVTFFSFVSLGNSLDATLK